MRKRSLGEHSSPMPRGVLLNLLVAPTILLHFGKFEESRVWTSLSARRLEVLTH